MNLFDQLVNQALQTQNTLTPLRVVVEKELLHHDVLREMAEAGLLNQLTFIGGTCLRACYGSNRLSEDLDFTGGADFKRETLQQLGQVLVKRLHTKYGLQVEVSEPQRETGNVDTWKLKIITHPEQRNLPAQRINIDICAIPSYDRQPMVLRNHYEVDMGTYGLILQAQSRAEILADKLVAFALRLNRIKNRDLWDIAWLKQQAIELPLELVAKKIQDHQQTNPQFIQLLQNRVAQLLDSATKMDFLKEIQRFLPPQVATRTLQQPEFWAYLANTVQEESEKVIQFLQNSTNTSRFEM